MIHQALEVKTLLCSEVVALRLDAEMTSADVSLRAGPLVLSLTRDVHEGHPVHIYHMYPTQQLSLLPIRIHQQETWQQSDTQSG